MARTANSQTIEREEQGPDFEGAISLIRGRIRTNQSEIRSIAQDQSTLFKRVDKEKGVHAGAAKDFAKIDAMAAEKRTDYLRSLLGLLNYAGYDNFDDLVDRAQKPQGKGAGKSAAKSKSEQPKAKAPDALDASGTNGNIEQADVDPEIQAQRDQDAEQFNDGDVPPNVHKFPQTRQ